ncbi:unnamed protein product [Phaeothamnion confervicola]
MDRSNRHSEARQAVAETAGPKGARQVVLLGAGMDSRALRLPLPPGTKVRQRRPLPAVAAAAAATATAAAATRSVWQWRRTCLATSGRRRWRRPDTRRRSAVCGCWKGSSCTWRARTCCGCYGRSMP